jgi:hypothetical protein
MNFEHNLLAHAAGKLILRQLQGGAAPWATPRLTRTCGYWQGIADWPVPDIALQDTTTGATLAVEFKPPGQPKREYVTGLGQALTYLSSFEYSAIVLPSKSADGFEIASYLHQNLQEPCAVGLPVALFVYERNPGDETDLRPLLGLRERPGIPPPPPSNVGRKVFWAYWRDLSQYDLFTLLQAMDASDAANPYKYAYRRFWTKKMAVGLAQTWEGRHRKPRARNSPSYKSERLNAFLSTKHIGVVTSEGRLTEEGIALLRQGKVYGPSSVSFMNTLGRLVLDRGRHLDLILWVEEQQRGISRRRKRSAADFYHGLDLCLQSAGIIPRAPTRRPKPTFLRDEQKLWNKLGLLVPSGRGGYFHAGLGIAFNWRAIISIME